MLAGKNAMRALFVPFLEGKLSLPFANRVLAGKNLIGGAKVIRF